MALPRYTVVRFALLVSSLLWCTTCEGNSTEQEWLHKWSVEADGKWPQTRQRQQQRQHGHRRQRRPFMRRAKSSDRGDLLELEEKERAVLGVLPNPHPTGIIIRSENAAEEDAEAAEEEEETESEIFSSTPEPADEPPPRPRIHGYCNHRRRISEGCFGPNDDYDQSRRRCTEYADCVNDSTDGDPWLEPLHRRRCESFCR
mmetsp:Transcript_867/g.1805  ORF Transcript_867/g.1805 Transcript_867/m.1805 type:complete len:201 (-) Transcript_867:2-604(-)